MNIWIILLLAFLFIDLVVVLVVFIKKSHGRGFSSHDLLYIKDHWLEVELAYSEEDYKSAVMDADKILDYALGRRGFAGNLGEKLKQGQYLFSNLNGVWAAHKLRNRVAHELVEVNENEIKFALKQFKQALFDLGIKF
ncbi:MAG: hypothetical protein WC269_00365 [Candidatus Gracilibacteria bacterium]|jgi:hypothetical protein